MKPLQNMLILPTNPTKREFADYILECKQKICLPSKKLNHILKIYSNRTCNRYWIDQSNSAILPFH